MMCISFAYETCSWVNRIVYVVLWADRATEEYFTALAQVRGQVALLPTCYVGSVCNTPVSRTDVCMPLAADEDCSIEIGCTCCVVDVFCHTDVMLAVPVLCSQCRVFMLGASSVDA